MKIIKTRDSEILKAFSVNPDTILYIASIDGRNIGASAVWRDRRRLGMVLGALEIIPGLRETVSSQLIKSSIPWFRSLAIREVDVLIHTEDTTDYLFPSLSVLPKWTEQVIINTGFRPADSYYHCSLNIRDSVYEGSNQTGVMKQYDSEWTRNTLWNLRKQLNLDISHAWLALALHESMNAITTFHHEEQPVLSMMHHSLDDRLIVGPLIHSSETGQDYLAAVIASMIVNSKQAEFTLVSRSQLPLLKSVVKLCGCEMQVKELLLLRREY